MKLISVLILFYLFSIFSIATAQEATDTVATKNKLFGVPIAFFAPETSWGFGAASIYTFRLKGEPSTSYPSQLQLGFAYTLNKQVLFYLPYQLYVNDENYKVYGELGYYLYTYQFYGIGNQTAESDAEFYDVDFPRLRLNVLKQWYPNFSAGLRYWMDDFKIQQVAADGFLEREDIAGNKGGFLSGVGIVLNYDNRDNIFFPTAGVFAEVVGFRNSKIVGSDFNFSKLYIDASSFWSIRNQVIGVNLYAELSSGTVPFNQLSLLGGPKRMRGYFEGRFRDNHYLSLQAEYRFPLYWKWLRGVLFTGVGDVSHTLADFQLSTMKIQYGAGLRILVNAEEKVYIRLDAGFGKATSGYYITIGEAF